MVVTVESGRSQATTRQLILDAAVAQIEASGSDSLKIRATAQSAHVGAPTIYYYFSSRSGLIAEAQLDRVRRKASGDLERFARIVEAIERGDGNDIDEAANDLAVDLSDLSRHGSIWDYLEMLFDIRKVPRLLAQLRWHLLEEVDRWSALVERLQSLELVDPTLAPRALALTLLGSNLGRALTELEPRLSPEPGASIDLIRRFLRSTRLAPSLDH